MNALSLEVQVRLVGVLCFLLAVYAFWLGELKVKDLPGHYDNPVLALELVASDDDIHRISKAETVNNKGETVKARDFISKQLKKDSGFIVLYVLFFSSLGLLLAQLTSSALRWTAIASVVCGVLAGLLDLIENRGMRKALALPDGARTNDLANMIRYPSLAKWALIYIFSILIGIVFLWGRRHGINPLIYGFLFLLGGVVGLSGVIANLYQPQFYRMFPLSQLIMALGSLWLAIVFTFKPARIISNFTS